MSWERNRPVYHKLPTDSGDWQGNPIVDYLTSFWDNLLVGSKSAVDDPDQWLGNPDQIDPYFLDWIAIGLCGYAAFWDPDLPDQVRRELIRSYPEIRDRVSYNSANTLVKAIIPDGAIDRVELARAGTARAGLAYTYDPRDNRYWIRVPHTIPRDGVIWQTLNRVIRNWLPIGLGRVQYHPSAIGYTVIGDSILSDSRGTYEY